ncbi:MAG: FlgD immunoglobulin-like domain containing protein, partial [candidate division KSB1 bacterium]
ESAAQAGFRLIDYETYKTSQGPRFAGIWVADGEDWALLLNYDNRTAFEADVQSLESSDDLRPVSFEVFTGELSTAVAEQTTATISSYELSQNYPNPFNPETTIRYALPSRAQAQLVIYDLTGRIVKELVSEQQAPGEHAVQWNGRDDAGNSVASGVYVYRLVATPATGAPVTLTRKLTFMK